MMDEVWIVFSNATPSSVFTSYTDYLEWCNSNNDILMAIRGLGVDIEVVKYYRGDV
jgi:hypothetical protein